MGVDGVFTSGAKIKDIAAFIRTKLGESVQTTDKGRA
jgi:methylmalonyl-CoA mutase cobalamin-binding subunit